MKKILILANFNSLPWEKGNGRFSYIANLLSQNGYDVGLICSSFYHGNKKQRNVTQENLNSINYKLKLIYEPGYKRNVSFSRIISHYILSKKLKKYLNSLTAKPDVIYCAVPSLDFAKEAIKYSKKNNIKFIIDVQDLWPEAFNMILNVPIISNIIFNPMKKKADYIYSNADEIVAISETYLQRAIHVNTKVKKGSSIYLGTDLNYVDECIRNYKTEFDDKYIRIAYVGTLGASYDIKLIIDAIKILNEKGYKNVKFVIMGDGPLKKKFENYAKLKTVNCDFKGNMEYSQMMGLLASCDIAVNPINSHSVASIINKVGDYAACRTTSNQHSTIE